MDFADIRGQEAAKRASLVAIAGNHSILFYGPSGCGKSMLRNAIEDISTKVATEELWPCPCGNFTDPRLACSCNSERIRQYWIAIQRQLNRTQIHVEVPPLSVNDLFDSRSGTSTNNIRLQLMDLQPVKIPKPWTLNGSCQQMLKQAFTELGLSMRQIDNILSVSATIASLDHKATIEPQHLAEAIQYRKLSRMPTEKL